MLFMDSCTRTGAFYAIPGVSDVIPDNMIKIYLYRKQQWACMVNNSPDVPWRHIIRRLFYVVYSQYIP